MKKQLREEIEKILQANFNPYFGEKLFGKGALELKCKVFAPILEALFQKYLEGEVEEIRKAVEDLVEVEPAVTLGGQKVVSLSWTKYLDLKSRLSKQPIKGESK